MSLLTGSQKTLYSSKAWIDRRAARAKRRAQYNRAPSVGFGGGGGHVHRGLTVARRPAGRDGTVPQLLVTNFDGLHSEGTAIGPTVIHSAFAHIGDDFFNVQDAIDVVLGADPAAGTVVVFDSFLEHEVLEARRDRYALAFWIFAER